MNHSYYIKSVYKFQKLCEMHLYEIQYSLEFMQKGVQ